MHLNLQLAHTPQTRALVRARLMSCAPLVPLNPDLNLLEEVQRVDDVAKRCCPPFPKQQLPPHLSTLLYQANRRRIDLRLMNPGGAATVGELRGPAGACAVAGVGGRGGSAGACIIHAAVPGTQAMRQPEAHEPRSDRGAGLGDTKRAKWSLQRKSRGQLQGRTVHRGLGRGRVRDWPEAREP